MKRIILSAMIAASAVAFADSITSANVVGYSSAMIKAGRQAITAPFTQNGGYTRDMLKDAQEYDCIELLRNGSPVKRLFAREQDGQLHWIDSQTQLIADNLVLSDYDTTFWYERFVDVKSGIPFTGSISTVEAISYSPPPSYRSFGQDKPVGTIEFPKSISTNSVFTIRLVDGQRILVKLDANRKLVLAKSDKALSIPIDRVIGFSYAQSANQDEEAARRDAQAMNDRLLSEKAREFLRSLLDAIWRSCTGRPFVRSDWRWSLFAASILLPAIHWVTWAFLTAWKFLIIKLPTCVAHKIKTPRTTNLFTRVTTMTKTMRQITVPLRQLLFWCRVLIKRKTPVLVFSITVVCTALVIIFRLTRITPGDSITFQLCIGGVSSAFIALLLEILSGVADVQSERKRILNFNKTIEPTIKKYVQSYIYITDKDITRATATSQTILNASRAGVDAMPTNVEIEDMANMFGHVYLPLEPMNVPAIQLFAKSERELDESIERFLTTTGMQHFTTIQKLLGEFINFNRTYDTLGKILKDKEQFIGDHSVDTLFQTKVQNGTFYTRSDGNDRADPWLAHYAVLREVLVRSRELLVQYEDAIEKLDSTHWDSI